MNRWAGGGYSWAGGSEGDQILWGSAAVSTPVGVGLWGAWASMPGTGSPAGHLGGSQVLCFQGSGANFLLGAVAPGSGACCLLPFWGPFAVWGGSHLGPCTESSLGWLLGCRWGVLPSSVFPRRFLPGQGSAFLAHRHPLSNFLTHTRTKYKSIDVNE